MVDTTAILDLDARPIKYGGRWQIEVLKTETFEDVDGKEYKDEFSLMGKRIAVYLEMDIFEFNKLVIEYKGKVSTETFIKDELLPPPRNIESDYVYIFNTKAMADSFCSKLNSIILINHMNNNI